MICFWIHGFKVDFSSKRKVIQKVDKISWLQALVDKTLLGLLWRKISLQEALSMWAILFSKTIKN